VPCIEKAGDCDDPKNPFYKPRECCVRALATAYPQCTDFMMGKGRCSTTQDSTYDRTYPLVVPPLPLLSPRPLL
jgi:hypothetical protein